MRRMMDDGEKTIYDPAGVEDALIACYPGSPTLSYSTRPLWGRKVRLAEQVGEKD